MGCCGGLEELASCNLSAGRNDATLEIIRGRDRKDSVDIQGQSAKRNSQGKKMNTIIYILISTRTVPSGARFSSLSVNFLITSLSTRRWCWTRLGIGIDGDPPSILSWLRLRVAQQGNEQFVSGGSSSLMLWMSGDGILHSNSCSADDRLDCVDIVESGLGNTHSLAWHSISLRSSVSRFWKKLVGFWVGLGPGSAVTGRQVA